MRLFSDRVQPAADSFTRLETPVATGLHIGSLAWSLASLLVLRRQARAHNAPGRSNTGLPPMGKRRSIMTTVPAHGDLSPRARIYFFVFVVHTMSIMAGAMQFSARGGVDIRCHAC
jgi:hypothetical protein